MCLVILDCSCGLFSSALEAKVCLRSCSRGPGCPGPSRTPSLRRRKMKVSIAVETFIFLLRKLGVREGDRKSTRLNSSHVKISYAVFCLKKKKQEKSI